VVREKKGEMPPVAISPSFPTHCDVQMQSVDLCLFVKAKFLVFVIFWPFGELRYEGSTAVSALIPAKRAERKKAAV
jgi:hypothetical protein